jgi:subtilisin family serine protease
VAATNGDDTRAYFTNYGPEIDLSAPGVELMHLRFGPGGGRWGRPGKVFASGMVDGKGEAAVDRHRRYQYLYD